MAKRRRTTPVEQQGPEHAGQQQQQSHDEAPGSPSASEELDGDDQLEFNALSGMRPLHPQLLHAE